MSENYLQKIVIGDKRDPLLKILVKKTGNRLLIHYKDKIITDGGTIKDGIELEPRGEFENVEQGFEMCFNSLLSRILSRITCEKLKQSPWIVPEMIVEMERDIPGYLEMFIQDLRSDVKVIKASNVTITKANMRKKLAEMCRG